MMAHGCKSEKKKKNEMKIFFFESVYEKATATTKCVQKWNYECIESYYHQNDNIEPVFKNWILSSHRCRRTLKVPLRFLVHIMFGILH